MDIGGGRIQMHSLDDVCNELRTVFESDEVDVDYVHEILSSYKSNPKDWRKYCHFDRHRYTRNLIDAGNGKYNLMLLAWAEGQGSGIHDHADSHCFVKVLSGTLTEVRFSWPEPVNGKEMLEEVKEMQVIQETDVDTNEVTYMNDSIGLHRMENRNHSMPAVTLHLYVPSYESCRNFDQRTGHASTCKVTFYSKNGKRTPYTSKELSLTFENN
ncbi:Cysteine dioxygenase type 1 [Halotydeus destructor]|nr:Cysteine dioxygenase type 1 [Halotydeus destructor]